AFAKAIQNDVLTHHQFLALPLKHLFGLESCQLPRTNEFGRQRLYIGVGTCLGVERLERLLVKQMELRQGGKKGRDLSVFCGWHAYSGEHGTGWPTPRIGTRLLQRGHARKSRVGTTPRSSWRKRGRDRRSSLSRGWR